MTSTGITGASTYPRGEFPTTHWSLIAQVKPAGSAESLAALEQLCQIYWYPVYCFARRQYGIRQDAEDVTQGFFADLLARDALSRADHARGRFRTFLLCSLKNFCSHKREQAQAVKRGGRCEIISLEMLEQANSCVQYMPANNDSPEAIFDREWALSLITATFARVKYEYTMLGKADLFEALKESLWAKRGDVRYADIARQQVSTEAAIKVAAYRLRQSVREQLRLEVARTLARAEDVDDELRTLFPALCSQG